ncbi:MAG: family 10 glycosylhydrolase [Bacilli bacterium]
MKYFKKLLITLLLFLLLTIDVKAWTVPTTYEEPLVELRGAWVSTVSNIDIGRQTSIEQYKSQYIQILNNFERFNMNAVFFQVRPTNDAFYESVINPWSVYLIGKQGQDPGWDPLPWLVEETHKRGMEFHAWLNPYRASLDVFSENNLTGSEYERQLNAALENMDDMNFAKQNPDLLIQGGRRILLNPAEERVRQHIYNTILEIVNKYDVDAIHFDDYFYTDVALSADRAQYMEMSRAATYSTLAHQDWRRHQVDLLVEGIHDRLEAFNDSSDRDVQFGISPAAGWAPSTQTCPAYPNGRGFVDGMEGYPCYGYSSYHDLYADTRKWVKEEWLDYILPQNYFELGRYHEEITDWWSRQVEGTSVKLYMGIGLYQYGNYDYLTQDEYVNQIKFNQQYSNVKGYVIFSYRSFLYRSNPQWVEGVNKLEELWNITPLLPHGITNEATETKVQDINLLRKNGFVEISFDSNPNAHGYVIYRFNHGDTPDISNNNIYKLITNKSDSIMFNDFVENTQTFDYYVRAVLKDGSLSDYTVLKEMEYVFINDAPTIKFINHTQSRVMVANDKFMVEVEVDDINDDALEVLLSYSTNGRNYSSNTPVNIVNNRAYFEFTIPRYETELGSIRVGVSDGSEYVYVFTHTFEVVQDMGFLQSQLYYLTKQINNSIKGVLG